MKALADCLNCGVCRWCIDRSITAVYPACHDDEPLPNVWLGVSVENQAAADERIPHLLRTPAAVRFLSCEPLLGPVDLRHIRPAQKPEAAMRPVTGEVVEANCLSGDCITSLGFGYSGGPTVSWVIVGGESGPGARPCNIEWVRSVVRQCQAAGVPVFVKQLGSQPEFGAGECVRWADAGPTQRLRDKKGGDIAEWPADLRVREFPAAAGAVSAPATVEGT